MSAYPPTERVVWKYELANVVNEIGMPRYSRVLHVAEQQGAIYLWALVHKSAAAELDMRKFYVVGTGHDMPPDVFPPVHLGSLLVQGGNFVFHVFESLDEQLSK